MAQNKLHFTKKAVSDLSEIWNYTLTTCSEQQADEYYSALISCCQHLLRESTVLSRTYDKIHEALKGIKCGQHIIFYKKDSSGKVVLIVRILHERMDLKRYL